MNDQRAPRVPLEIPNDRSLLKSFVTLAFDEKLLAHPGASFVEMFQIETSSERNKLTPGNHTNKIPESEIKKQMNGPKCLNFPFSQRNNAFFTMLDDHCDD